MSTPPPAASSSSSSSGSDNSNLSLEFVGIASATRVPINLYTPAKSDNPFALEHNNTALYAVPLNFFSTRSSAGRRTHTVSHETANRIAKDVATTAGSTLVAESARLRGGGGSAEASSLEYFSALDANVDLRSLCFPLARLCIEATAVTPAPTSYAISVIPIVLLPLFLVRLPATVRLHSTLSAHSFQALLDSTRQALLCRSACPATHAYYVRMIDCLFAMRGMWGRLAPENYSLVWYGGDNDDGGGDDDDESDAAATTAAASPSFPTVVSSHVDVLTRSAVEHTVLEMIREGVYTARIFCRTIRDDGSRALACVQAIPNTPFDIHIEHEPTESPGAVPPLRVVNDVPSPLPLRRYSIDYNSSSSNATNVKKRAYNNGGGDDE